MEAKIGFTKEEIGTLLEQWCQQLFPAPDGMKWVTMRVFMDAYCELATIKELEEAVAPMPIAPVPPPPEPFIAPSHAVPDEVAF